MKSITVLTLLILSSSVALGRFGQKKMSPEIIGVKPDALPSTPKGDDLRNHYGTPISADIYGPKPTAVVEGTAHGVIYANNEEDVFLSQKGGKSVCHIEEKPYYQICLQLQDCDLCSASPHCGWCQTLQRCLPGTAEYSSCPKSCPVTWIFEPNRCVGKVRAGKFTNVAPEATELITPEIKGPTVNVHSKSYHHGVLTHRKKVGYKMEHADIHAVDPVQGKITHYRAEVAKPVIGEFNQPVAIATHHEKSVNLETGHVKDYYKPQSLHYLGTDGYPGQEDQLAELKEQAELGGDAGEEEE